MKTYYQILGVSATATEPEIKAAFRKLAKENHPDTHPGDNAAVERFKEANEAYLTLSDELKREEYDQKLNAPVRKKRAATPQGAPMDFGSMNFGDMFGSIFEDLEQDRSAQGKKKEQPKQEAGKGKKDDPLNVDDIFAKFMGFKP